MISHRLWHQITLDCAQIDSILVQEWYSTFMRGWFSCFHGASVFWNLPQPATSISSKPSWIRTQMGKTDRQKHAISRSDSFFRDSDGFRWPWSECRFRFLTVSLITIQIQIQVFCENSKSILGLKKWSLDVSNIDHLGGLLIVSGTKILISSILEGLKRWKHVWSALRVHYCAFGTSKHSKFIVEIES